MIDEDALRELLAQAADSAPPPGGPPEDLLEGLARQQAEVPHPALGRPGRILAVAAAVVVTLGIGAALLGDEDPRSGVAASPGQEDSAIALSTTVPGFAEGGSPALEAAPPAAVADADASGGGAADQGTTARESELVDSASVVKTGSMSLEVEEGAYDRSVDLLTTKVAGMGGYVAQSSTSRTDDRPAGSLVLRVPAAQFDQLMADLRKLGTVLSEDSQGVDVGGQVADLDARLSALRATRDKLTTILAEAEGIDETLMVQDRITGVQTQIEQLEGQQRGLQDQVEMSSITVNLGEPGAERIELHADERDLGGAWADARRRFGDGVEDLVAWSGSAALVLLVGAVGALGLRLAWPRLRRMLL